MPNRVALLRAAIEAAHPDAVLKHRGEAGFAYVLPDGREEHRYTTGPWHWQQPGDTDWREIDTDLEARPDATWVHGVKSARFDTVMASNGRKRFIPRRWIPGEYVQFGILQYQRLAGSWATVPTGVLSRVENRLVGTEQTNSRLEIGFNGRGSRTHLVLKNATLARPIRWQVTLVGLTWTDGVLTSNSDGAQVGFVRAPTWTDASEPPVPREIPWVYSGGYMTLTPTFEGAVYPIVVDPDYSIAATGDDGWAYQFDVSTVNLDTSNATIYVGQQIGVQEYRGWFRFAAITAAHDQDCTAASIAVYSTYTLGATRKTRFYGVDEDDHVAPSTAAAWVTDHGIHTTAYVDWDITTWTVGTKYTSPDLQAIFDELFARDNWTTGYDVGIHWDENGGDNGTYAGFASWDNTTYTEPVLSLTLAAAGTAHTLVGATTAAVTVAAGMKLVKRLAGTVAAAATVQGALAIGHRLAGTVVTAVTVEGALGILQQQTGTATFGAVAGFTVTGQSGRPLNGTVEAASSVTGDLATVAGSEAHELVGTVGATAAVQGALTVTRQLAGATVSAVTVVGGLVKGIPLAGAVVAATTITADLTGIRQLHGAITAAAAVAGDLTVAHQIAGTVTATASVTGTLAVDHPLVGAIEAAATVAGTISTREEVRLPGTVTATSLVVGALAIGHNLTGAITAVATIVGTAKPGHQLIGATAASATISGALQQGRNLIGTITAATTVGADLKLDRQIIAAITSLSALTGTILTWNLGRIGFVYPTDRLAGYVTAAEALAGTAETSEALAGTVTASEAGGP